jgi:hypothetical protein
VSWHKHCGGAPLPIVWWFTGLVIVFLMVASANAGSVAFCDLCTGFTVSKRGTDVLLRCPGKATPWMTIKDCANPKVDRSVPSRVSIACNSK